MHLLEPCNQKTLKIQYLTRLNIGFYDDGVDMRMHHLSNIIIIWHADKNFREELINDENYYALSIMQNK